VFSVQAVNPSVAELSSGDDALTNQSTQRLSDPDFRSPYRINCNLRDGKWFTGVSENDHDRAV
jgi:hypothetical protein